MEARNAITGRLQATEHAESGAVLEMEDSMNIPRNYFSQ
jgi:hypothetical protein